MDTINSGQPIEEAHNLLEEKSSHDPMFFYKGVVIGGSFSLLFWAIIVWAIC